MTMGTKVAKIIDHFIFLKTSKKPRLLILYTTHPAHDKSFPTESAARAALSLSGATA